MAGNFLLPPSLEVPYAAAWWALVSCLAVPVGMHGCTLHLPGYAWLGSRILSRLSPQQHVSWQFAYRAWDDLGFSGGGHAGKVSVLQVPL